MSDAGTLVILLIPAPEAVPRENVVVLLDAATLELQAEFVLPIAPLSAAGLHNFYSTEPASV